MRNFHHSDVTEEESTDSISHLPKSTQQVKDGPRFVTRAAHTGLLFTSSNSQKDLLPTLHHQMSPSRWVRRGADRRNTEKDTAFRKVLILKGTIVAAYKVSRPGFPHLESDDKEPTAWPCQISKDQTDVPRAQSRAL